MDLTTTNRFAAATNRFDEIDRTQKLEAMLGRYRIKPVPVATVRPAAGVDDCGPLEPIETWSHEITPEQLERQLLAKLPFLSRGPSCLTSRRRIHLGYDEALAKLQGWRVEARRFFRQIVRSAGKLEGFRRDRETIKKARLAITDLLSEFYDFQFSPLKTPRSLELSAQRNKKLIHHVYAHHLGPAVAQFAAEFFSQLERMRARGIVGSARYAGVGRDLHCEFTTFYSRAIRQTESVQNKKIDDAFEEIDWHEDKQAWIEQRRRTTELITSGSVTIQHVHAASLLGDVTVHSLGKWNKPVPARIAKLFTAIPSFLKASCLVTDGHQREGLEIAKDVNAFPWSYSEERSDPHLIRHYDPFVSIPGRDGALVVGYWCDQERTLSRREWSRRRKDLVS